MLGIYRLLNRKSTWKGFGFFMCTNYCFSEKKVETWWKLLSALHMLCHLVFMTALWNSNFIICIVQLQKPNFRKVGQFACTVAKGEVREWITCLQSPSSLWCLHCLPVSGFMAGLRRQGSSVIGAVCLGGLLDLETNKHGLEWGWQNA